MARKKNSAAKQMHVEADPWRQVQISIFGPRLHELHDAVDFWAWMLICDDEGKLGEWMQAHGLNFFKRIVADARRCDGAFLRRMADAAEENLAPMMDGLDAAKRVQIPEPWRQWLVVLYSLPFKDVMVDGVCRMVPMRQPDTIPFIQQSLANKFNVHLEDRKLRQELKALGVPFAPSKRGRPPKKKPRRKS